MICMHTSPTASGQAMLTVSASSWVGACYSFSNVALIWEPCRRVRIKRGNGTDRRNRNGGTGEAETEKRVKRGKEDKTRKRG
jgi:hypothetical protein